MTQEHPEREIKFCDRCNAAIRLERINRSLKITCACDNTRDVGINSPLPEEWV